MEIGLLPVVALFSLAVVLSHAALTPEDYWESVLPNTRMPKAVQARLTPDFEYEKSTSVNVGKGGVAVDSTNPGKPGTNVHVGKGGVIVNTGKPGGKGTAVNVGKGGVVVNTGKPGGKGTVVNVGKGGVGVHTNKHGGKGTSVNIGKGGVTVGSGKGKPGGTRVNVGKGGVGVNTRHKGKPVVVRVHPGPNPFNYNYAASEDQLHDDPNVALFFLEKDLHPGTKMNLHFTETTNGATFLPRQIADAIPFSSNKMTEIYKQFSVEPKSIEANAMKQTIEECEAPAQEGEDKHCATSLESMIDFSTSKLGGNVKALSTEIDEEETHKQQYNISGSVRKMVGDKSVVCHDQTFAYAVFYCHSTHSTRTYMVPLVGTDGTKVKAVAVCHTDTSKWNPMHLAFQVLKVKPGTVPICHFLPEDHIVWVPKNYL